MSIQKWRRKKEKALSEGKLQDIYHACIELAELYYNDDNYDQALIEYKEAEVAAAADGNPINMAVAHRMIGQVYTSMLEHNLAIEHQLKYLELSRKESNEIEEQRALATLGQTYFVKAENYTYPKSVEKYEALEMAKKYYMKSLQVCERLINVKPKEQMEMKGRLFLNLGLVMDEQNKPDVAIDYFNKAIYVGKSMDLWDDLYRSYYSLGSLYQKQANYALALQNYDKALDVAQRLPDKSDKLCYILVLKGEVLFNLPDFRGSKQIFLKAYKLRTKDKLEVEKKLRIVAAINKFEEQLLETQSEDLATMKSLYESLGDGCAAMKNYSKALEYYYLMLKTAEDLGESGEKLRPCYISLSQTYKDNKQYNMAIEYFERELQLYDNNPLESCKTVINIADVLEIKESSVEEITSMYKKALTLAQEAGNLTLEKTALACLVRIYKQNKMYASLEEFEIKLKSVIEKMKHADSLSTSEDDEEEENTPDIGADINLDALSDSDVESSGSARAAKKKRTGFHFKRNEKGETPLHTACINGNLTLVQKLLDQGHPVDIRDHSGWLPLHEACNFGHTEIVKLLLDKGAAINDRGTATCGGMTPLLDAATCGNLSVMELLLERGASPLMRTNQGETVLDCLVAWRERYKQEEHRDLDSETLSYYHDMVQMLRAAIEKAGHKPRGPMSENNSVSQATMQRRYSDSLTLSTRNIRRSSSEGKPRRSTEDKCERRGGTSRNENAASEYENAIKALRYKPASLTHQVHTQTKQEEKSPLINQNEMVDDWLIDDMEATGRGVKRKKGHQFEGQQLRKLQESQSLRKNDRGRSCNFRAISPVDCSSDSDSEPRIPSQLLRKNEPTIIESDDSSSSNLAQLTEMIETDDGVTRSQSNEPIRLPLSRKKQISLLSTGVSRQVISRPNEPSTSSNLTQNQRPSPTNISTQLVPCQSVKVRIEQKLLLVPLPTNQEAPLTVEWLAKEAARRYHSLEGVEPKLSLSTEDGALLAPDDPISLLLSSPEVHATVSSWNLAPLNHRYKEACTALKLDMDDHIEWSLDACQATTVLCLEDCALLPIQFKPVVKALSHHNALQHLKLSGNQLGDEGVQVLSECVMKLCQLRELDISCNDITQEGFSHLAQQATQHRGLQNLEKLNLSHNPLGEDCLRSLGQVLKCSAALSTLEMVDVGLSPVSFRGCPELSLDSVEHLNLSYNTLDREGVDALLSRLEPTRLISLKLASTGDNIVREVALFFDQRDPYNLQYLDVSYCNAVDDDIVQLVKSLQHANQLQSLEINGNKLSDSSTLSEIYRLPINRLSMLGVEINDVLPQAPVAQFSCLSLVQQPWGCSGPFGLVTTDTIGT